MRSVLRLWLTLLVLCICTPALAETTEQITYTEPYGKSLRIAAESTETAHARYLFEGSIPAETREACIRRTDVLLSLLPMAEQPEICVLAAETFGGVRIDGHRLVLSPMDWDSVDYGALVLQAAAGEYSHYGLAYGLAAVLTGDAGAFVSPSQVDVFDLNLLCLDAAFVSAEDASAARQLSAAFAAAYLDANGLDACWALLCQSATAEGMEHLAEALRLFCADNGQTVQPGTLRIAQGGAAYQYRVLTEGAEYWVGRAWQDINCALNPLVTENFLHGDYASTAAFFRINEVQMAAYRQLFSCENAPCVTVLLPNPLNGLNASCYQSGDHRILLLNADSLSHEYIHALAQPSTTQESWETEGFARYFSYYYDHYGIAMVNADYAAAADTEKLHYIYEFRAQVGREIDMAVDFGAIESIIAYTRGYASPNVSYASGSAFVHYLVQRYGEEAVIRHVLDGAAFDAPQTELVADWKAWLKDNYGGYTQVTQSTTTKKAPSLPPGKNSK